MKKKLKTLKGTHQRNEIHPIMIDLSELYLQALHENFPATAWCIDLARTALVSEQIAKAAGKSEMYAQNEIRRKIQKDKGIKIG